MARLWRSVAFLAICFAAVVAMRIYLNKQVELARATQNYDGGIETTPANR
jgi:hypothetical protein